MFGSLSPTIDPLVAEDWLRPQDLRRLLLVAQRLGGARRLDEVGNIVSEAAQAMTEASGATFLIVRGDRLLSPGHPQPRGTRRRSAERCLARWCVVEGRTAVVHDVRLDERVPQEAFAPPHYRSVLMAPILRSHPVGALGVYWNEVHTPSIHQIAILEKLAETASYSVLAGKRREKYLRGITHDLRNPLATIQLSTHLIEPRSPESRKHLASIRESVEGIERLIHAHLDPG